jgi:hypothetical protein
MRKQKKGQITIFIIIGIILLLTVVLFIFLRKEITFFRPSEVVPPELVPVINYMDDCLNQLGTEAANIVGSTGGYIEIPQQIVQDPFSYIALAPIEVERAKVPFWYYLGQKRIPTIEFIEDQMSHYIEDNYRDCVDNFTGFRNQFNITELGPIIARVKLEDANTPIELSFPLEFADIIGTKIGKIDARKVTLPFRIKRAVNLAEAVMEAEEQDMKLEDITMDLMAIDSGIPVQGGPEFSCEKIRWNVEDIQNKLKALLRTNLPFIRIGNTGYLEVPEDMPYILHHYIWYVTDISYPDLVVSFTFDERWPFHLYARPNKGNYLESGMQRGFDVLSMLCMQTWKFTYDIRFPIMATVKDKKSGYSFNFAFRALIDHNQGNRRTFPVSVFEFETRPTAEEYCTRKVYEMTVFTYDNVSKDGIEDHIEIADVDLEYTCLKYRCPLGKTEWTDGGAVATLTTKFPYCVLGILRGKKPGYKESFTFVSSDRPGTANLYLTPVKEIKSYTVVKHPDMNPLLEQPLAEGERAVINIKRAGHTIYGGYPIETDTPLTFLAEEDFEYSVEIYLTDAEGVKGGYIGNWTPRWSELRDAEDIKFHVIYSMDGDEDSRFTLVANLKNASKEVLEPELI